MSNQMATHEDMMIVRKQVENEGLFYFVIIPSDNCSCSPPSPITHSRHVVQAFKTLEEAEDYLTMFNNHDEED